MTTVREHTRRPPEKPADPFKPVMEARRRAYAKRWGIQPANTDDARLSSPCGRSGDGRPVAGIYRRRPSQSREGMEENGGIAKWLRKASRTA